jgi:hypothetical protein
VIRKIQRTEKFYIYVTPNDLRKLADDVQHAYDKCNETQSVGTLPIICGDIELEFCADINRMNQEWLRDAYEEI